MLQEGEGELAEKHVVVQAAPASALEMVKSQFVLHLLVHLFADPARLDRCRQGLQVGGGGQVREIICRVCTDHFTRARVESTA